MKNKIELTFVLMMGVGFLGCVLEFLLNIAELGTIAHVGLAALVVGILGTYVMDNYL